MVYCVLLCPLCMGPAISILKIRSLRIYSNTQIISKLGVQTHAESWPNTTVLAQFLDLVTKQSCCYRFTAAVNYHRLILPTSVQTQHEHA